MDSPSQLELPEHLRKKLIEACTRTGLLVTCDCRDTSSATQERVSVQAWQHMGAHKESLMGFDGPTDSLAGFVEDLIASMEKRRKGFIEVTRYAIAWRIIERYGYISLMLKDDVPGCSLPVQSAEEMMMITNLLRNEKPVFFDPQFQSLHVVGLWTGGNEAPAD